jgi:hypothetical protein
MVKIFTMSLHASKKPTLNEAEMRKIFDAGVETGIRKAEIAQHGDSEFRAVDGTPPWEDITVGCNATTISTID